MEEAVDEDPCRLANVFVGPGNGVVVISCLQNDHLVVLELALTGYLVRLSGRAAGTIDLRQVRLPSESKRKGRKTKIENETG